MQRPWNLPSFPVYSFATYMNHAVNMNICTYVTPVSMRPKLYIVALYHNTRTLQWMQKTDEAVLQLLNENQYTLVRSLGQKSGLKFNKQEWLEKKQLLTYWNQFKVLHGAAAYVRLKKINTLDTEGDHVLFLCKVLQYQSLSANILTTAILSNKKIISI